MNKTVLTKTCPESDLGRVRHKSIQSKVICALKQPAWLHQRALAKDTSTHRLDAALCLMNSPIHPTQRVLLFRSMQANCPYMEKVVLDFEGAKESKQTYFSPSFTLSLSRARYPHIYSYPSYLWTLQCPNRKSVYKTVLQGVISSWTLRSVFIATGLQTELLSR